MIESAAVKFFDEVQEKELIIPCHRHKDIQSILRAFGRATPATIIENGFLDECGIFYSRQQAWVEAVLSRQTFLENPYREPGVLYSEDLW